MCAFPWNEVQMHLKRKPNRFGPARLLLCDLPNYQSSPPYVASASIGSHMTAPSSFAFFCVQMGRRREVGGVCVGGVVLCGGGIVNPFVIVLNKKQKENSRLTLTMRALIFVIGPDKSWIFVFVLSNGFRTKERPRANYSNRFSSEP